MTTLKPGDSVKIKGRENIYIVDSYIGKKYTLKGMISDYSVDELTLVQDEVETPAAPAVERYAIGTRVKIMIDDILHREGQIGAIDIVYTPDGHAAGFQYRVCMEDGDKLHFNHNELEAIDAAGQAVAEVMEPVNYDDPLVVSRAILRELSGFIQSEFNPVTDERCKEWFVKKLAYVIKQLDTL